MRKSLRIFAVASAISIISTMTSMANWEQVDGAWKYSNNGVYLTGWQWLDGNGDNIAECYYLDANGVMAVNTVVDSYTVNESGAWTVNGVVQTKVVGSGGQTSNSNSGSHQNQSGIPSLDDIIADVGFADVDNMECGDSTGLPPMQAGAGGQSNSSQSTTNRHPDGLPIATIDSGSWEAECGDSTGLPPMH